MTSAQPVSIFLSCASQDLALAREIYGLFTDQGLRCFFYKGERAIALGEKWQAKLHEELLSADAVIVLVSEASEYSPYVLWEVNTALHAHKRLIPVFLTPAGGTGMMGMLAARLQEHQGITAAGLPAEALLSQLSAMLRDLLPQAQTRTLRLPAELATLLGREEDLASARQACLQHRLLVVAGSPGVGKTSFANRLARLLYDASADASAHWVQLQDARTGFGLADLVTTELNLQGVNNRQRDDQAILQQLGQALAQRPTGLILVLDNAEGLIARYPAAMQAIAEWVHHCRHLTVILTTRREPEFYSDDLFTLELRPLAKPRAEELANPTLASLRALPAVQLFIQARRGRTKDLEQIEQLRCVAEVCAALEGSPFLIRVAGESRLSPRDLLANLQDAVLAHEKVSAVLESSYQLLSPAAQSCFLQAATFLQGLSLQAAKAIFLLPPGQTAVSIIQELREHSLLEADERHFADDLPDRYHVYLPVREFALAKWKNSVPVELQTEHEKRFAAYYVAEAERLAEEHNGLGGGRAFSQLSSELENLLRVESEATAKGDWQLAGRTILAVTDYYCTRGPAAILLDRAQRLRAILPSAASAMAAQLDNALAMLRWEVSDWDGAMQASRAAMANLDELTPGSQARLRLLSQHVKLLQDRGFEEEGLQWLQRAAEESSAGKVTPLAPLWLRMELQTRWAEALEWTPQWQEGLHTFARLTKELDRNGNAAQQLSAHNRFGILLYRAGLATQSLHHFRLAQQANLEVRDAKRLGGMKTNIGIALTDLGRFAEAFTEFAEADPLHRKVGVRGWATVNAVAWARAECLSGAAEAAWRRLQEQEEEILHFPYESNHAWMYLWRGASALALARPLDAVADLSKAETMYRAMRHTNGYRFLHVLVCLAVARFQLVQNAGTAPTLPPDERQQLVALLEEALEIARLRRMEETCEAAHYRHRAAQARELLATLAGLP